MKNRFQRAAKWISVGTLAAAVVSPLGSAVASAATPTTPVQYNVYYYYTSGGNFDWNALLQQLYRNYPVQTQPSKPTTTAPSKPTTTAPSKPTTTAPSKPTTTPSQPTTPSKPTTSPSTSTSTSSYASQVVTLVNQERANAGLKPLAVNSQLANMALAKAKDMKNNNYFDHNSPTYGSPFDMMKSFGISYRYAGENIAMGQRTPQEVMTAWMNSSGHRANILNANYTSIGVAYYNGEWVQEFIG
ncbi:CAP domain-containing protein [Cohnella caldifontis]|uniref:CAP domain-containing protein n=1 Tax=Cohnella caldifontis TaxID=3027471 RepID=UPI0023EAB697|nr:CAP domain-containing protein [Cohnella sp. YIM B05605]